MSDEDLLPLQAEQDAAGFDVVLRGYDRRQVEDYVERVEVALAEADRQHLEDGERLSALEQEVASLHHRLEDAEHRAAGLPEPASRLTERLATMLRLAEEEAEQLIAQAQERAAASTSDRTAELDRREEQILGAASAAEQTRLEAQRDADALRLRAQQEAQALEEQARNRADELVQQTRQQAEQVLAQSTAESERIRRTAEEDVVILREQARVEEEARVAQAHAQLQDLHAQRDAVNAQLASLRQTLGAVQPLNPQDPDA